jgi:hypothetical protein
MPPRSSVQAEHSKRRMKRYFSTLMSNPAETPSRIASVASVAASRATAWLSGQRLISAETAFDIGMAFRSEFGWKTSGIEFLWAAGYWADVLSIIKYLALDRDFGTDAAVMLYSWLPQRMAKFECAEITARFADKYQADSPFSDQPVQSGFFESEQMQRIISTEPGAREIERYYEAFLGFDLDRDRRLKREELNEEFESDEFQERISTAWQRYNNGEFEGAPRLSAVLSNFNAVALFEMHIINATIKAARSLNDVMFPSYAIPKIWRLSAGWLYEIANSGPSIWFPALPDNFMNQSDVDLQTFEALELSGAFVLNDHGDEA